MVEYGHSEGGRVQAERGLGDPMTVARQSRPTTESVGRWAQALAGDPARVEQAAEILARLTDADLASWGYDRAAIRDELAAVEPAPRRRRARLARYALERRLLMRLRRNIHHNAFGRLVGRVRLACDVLLR